MNDLPPEFSDQFLTEFDQLLSWRRDVRSFKKNPLDEEKFEKLLIQALKQSPSVGNSQPWRAIRLKTSEIRKKVRAHVEVEHQQSAKIYGGDAVKHYNRLKLHGLDTAPEQLAIFSVKDPQEGKGLGRQTMPETLVWSTIMAIHTLWLKARAEGIGLGWVSILRADKMNEILECPAEWQFIAYLCMGYPEEESQTPELVREKWQERVPTEKLILHR
ncbi:5,6-dimethylbenzimidazole synthase [Kordiimonas sp. SCSIO 12603]|uniref:5,6-dimethylbenzimidazole synthase n=1 Tax=Kordiimonas sp. SCSIO 12603 TaxID=2829596 RepID=UPI00210268B4|nr:5,6-dimethylbenzimidazole synthase [Kordiimonas sp. SCSIO 12603]UTW57424.1 5,6-dimethylbenzimidazole synthase [Kordiimonas sp. SCSIO 12603]